MSGQPSIDCFMHMLMQGCANCVQVNFLGVFGQLPICIMTLINRVHTNSSKHHMQINETISSSFLVNSPYICFISLIINQWITSGLQKVFMPHIHFGLICGR